MKEVKRVIDMVGGAGYLQLALRGDDVATLKKASDALNEKMLAAKDAEGHPYVRFITYKVPVEFMQENMVLFIETKDLQEARKRITAYLRDQIRRASPFYFEIKKTKPVALDLKDLIDKYSSVGKKSIRDSYYISDDQKMMMILVKPMWNSTELQKTEEFIEYLTGGARPGQPTTQGLFADYAKQSGVSLVEDYEKMGDQKTLYFGFTGSYKTSLDDSYAIRQSLDSVFKWAFGLICFITILFFRKWAPTVLVISGMALGTVLTMGFARLTLGQLNMVTSIIGAILMGFGVDYGIHFIYRTRIELGTGKGYKEAISAALINAGRPALVAAVVTGGSFMVLLVSGFRGFSQFGFLAGVGTLIIGFTLFSWCPAILTLVGNQNPLWVPRLIGVMKPLKTVGRHGEIRIPRPRLLLALTSTAVAAVCAFAIPWTGTPLPKDRAPTLLDKLKAGVTFNYNSRALMPESQPSIKLQDEINRRFKISSDPLAVVTKDDAEAKEVYDEVAGHPEKYPAVDQVVSVYSFVPPPDRAQANAKVLAEWADELKDIDIDSLPPELQPKAEYFTKILHKKPFGLEGVPDVYRSLFVNLPTTRPENRGHLTFLYPGVDLWDGKKLLELDQQVRTIRTANGHVYHAAGLAILYATLSRIVLADGRLTVLLAALWILLMHYLDFRSVKLAAASVIPLGVGLWMMLGLLNLTNHNLNFMNLVILPILLGFGVSHGLYLLHRFLEGTSPVVALRSVGAAVASSTLTAIAGFGSLFFAQHAGLKSIGYVACLGLATTLVVSFTVLATVLQLIHDARPKHLLGDEEGAAPSPGEPAKPSEPDAAA